jgi:hypothetical protein
MRIRREYVIAILVLIVLLVMVGGVYQFYYKQRLAEYANNVTRLQAFESAMTRLDGAFSGYQPDVIIKRYRELVEPLREEVLRRASYFNTGDALQIDPIPEGKMLRFYYEEQFYKMLNDLRQEAQSRQPYCPYPDTSLGAPRPEDMARRTPTPLEVERALRKLRFGCTLVRMLMDAKAVAITQVEQWPPRSDYDNLLVMRTSGLAFVMYYKDLVNLVESLRVKGRYFTIDGLSIQNRFMRWPVEPPVEVQMLLTQAEFNPDAMNPPAIPQPTETVTVAAAQPGMSPAQALSMEGFERTRRSGREIAPPTRWQRTRNWLRNHFLWPF